MLEICTGVLQSSLFHGYTAIHPQNSRYFLWHFQWALQGALMIPETFLCLIFHGCIQVCALGSAGSSWLHSLVVSGIKVSPKPCE